METPRRTLQDRAKQAETSGRKGRVLHHKEGIGAYTRAVLAGGVALGAAVAIVGPKIVDAVNSSVGSEITALNPNAPPRPKPFITEGARANPTLDAEQTAYDKLVTNLSMFSGKANFVNGTIYIDPLSGKQVKQSTEAQGISNMLTVDVEGVGLVGVYIQTNTNGVESTIQGMSSTNSFPENGQGVQFAILSPGLIDQEGRKFGTAVSEADGFYSPDTKQTVELSAPVNS